MTATRTIEPLAADAGARRASTASRIASTGSTCVARRAGTSPETSVAIMPTARPTMIVRGAITVPVDGSSSPNEASSARSPGASRSPPRMPSTEATKPIDERLGDHGLQHLAARRAERAQQRELASSAARR